MDRPEEKADPDLIDGLVKDLDAGIDTLRSSGQNIIFTANSLKALREIPETATPGRVKGLRKMVQSFGTNKGRVIPLPNKDTFVDLRDEKLFIRFVFEEYLKALDLFLNGKGHHGFAGHVLTVGHALLELHRMGHKETANKGVEAYWQFVQQARNGAELGGKKVKEGPAQPPTQAPVLRGGAARSRDRLPYRTPRRAPGGQVRTLPQVEPASADHGRATAACDGQPRVRIHGLREVCTHSRAR